jgi:hypothetical protein
MLKTLMLDVIHSIILLNYGTINQMETLTVNYNYNYNFIIYNLILIFLFNRELIVFL